MTKSSDFISQALPLSRATLKSWVEPGDEANGFLSARTFVLVES